MKLKNLLAASAVAIAGAAGAASAQELTEAQDQAITLAQGFNACVTGLYQELSDFDAQIEQYAADNGFDARAEVFLETISKIENKFWSGEAITAEDEAAYEQAEAQLYALSDELYAAAEAAGITEPEINGYPEDICYDDLANAAVEAGTTVDQLDAELEGAYNTLGHDEFMSRIEAAPQP